MKIIYLVLLFSSLSIGAFAQYSANDGSVYDASKLLAVQNFRQARWMNEISASINTSSLKLNYLKGFKILPWMAINAGIGIETFELNSPRFVGLFHTGLKFPGIIGKYYSCFSTNYSFYNTKWSYYGGELFQKPFLNFNYQFGFPINEKTFLTIGLEYDFHRHHSGFLPNSGIRVGLII
jgi:hypothetical protein